MTDATILIKRLRVGDAEAANKLLPIVYEQLRATAGRYFRHQRSNHTLQPTALVHEAFVKLMHSADPDWNNSAHFCAVAATAMRQILADHARARSAQKRGGDADRETNLTIAAPSGVDETDLIALDELLTRLAEISPQQARIVELRFFGGLTLEQVAEVMGVARRTVDRSWRQSRAWLLARLGDDATEGT